MSRLGGFGLGLVLALSLGSAGAATDARTTPGGDHLIEREGIRIEFEANPARDAAAALKEGDLAEIRFKVSDAASGEPLSGRYPAVWMDVGETEKGDRLDKLTCEDRVGVYLQGLVGMRPLVDLNSYFVMVMNQGPSIDVIDPIIGITGITKLYTRIILPRPGADWAQSKNNKWLYVAMPQAGQLAIVDSEAFKLKENVAAGENPVRVRLQPDEAYAWVGNDARKPEQSGVSVIDLATRTPKAFIQTGRGHHEIAFSSDSRYAFVSNRQDGTVSMIDTASLTLVKQFKTGPKPLSLAYSDLARVLYVSDGESGEVVVIDPQKRAITERLQAAPGLGPVQVSVDGRWAAVVNPHANRVYIIDTAVNKIAHQIKVEGKPYELAFSENFVYVRALESERVSMIGIQHLGKPGNVPVNNFQAGTRAPNKINDISLASQFSKAPGEAAMMVVSPADASVYYYLEGMNAPMGTFRNYGQRPRAVMTVDRTVKEVAPGVYAASVKLPAAGKYEVAFLLDAPRMLHCFQVAVAEDPVARAKIKENQIDYLVEDRRVKVGQKQEIRFRLTDPKNQTPVSGLSDVRVLYYRAPGQQRTEVSATEVGEGVYAAQILPQAAGAYYLYVSAASRDIAYTDLPFLSLIGTR